MSPNDLVTKKDLDSFADVIVDRLLDKLGKPQPKPLPERVNGQWMIQRHFCGIGSYATLSRRLDDIEARAPELYDEIVYKADGQRTLYDPKKIRDWYEGRLREKEARKCEDPRLRLKRGEKI